MPYLPEVLIALAVLVVGMALYVLRPWRGGPHAS
jgi:hypothetical protein